MGIVVKDIVSYTTTTARCRLLIYAQYWYTESSSLLLEATSYLPLNTKKVIAHLLAPPDLLPSHPWHVNDTHHPHAPQIPHVLSVLLRKVAPHLGLVDVLVPIVCPLGHDPQHVLGHEVGREPARPGPRDGGQDQPPPGLDELAALVQEGGGVVDVFDYFEEGHHVEFLLVLGLGGKKGRKGLDGRREVG